MRAPTDFLSILAFLEMLREGGVSPAPPPTPSVPPMPPPPSPVQPAVFVPPGPVAPPGTLPPMPPWQGTITACPATLPPFPGPGWVPDTPPSDAVVAEAQRWNPILWNYASKTIVHPTVCEQFGGRWLTFAAAWHPDATTQTYMATEAWRLATDQPLPAPAPVPPPPPPPAPPMPHVIPPPGVIPAVVPIPPPIPVIPTPPPAPIPIPPPPVPTVVQTPLQHAAVLMAQALNTHGYVITDQAIYKAFQSAAGTTADGFPGTGTMGKLRTVLAQTVPPTPMPSVPIYPWRAMPGTSGYDGVNAPTWSQWSGQAPPAPVVPAVTPATGPPAPVEPYPGPGAYSSNSAYIARYQSALTYLSSMNPAYDPKGVDGKYGPNTIAAVKAFQADHGLTQDGQAGAATAAALDAAMGVSAAA